MKLTPVYVDYESFYSTDHSLSKMTNIEYVMHSDTEIISLAMKIADGPTEVVFGEPAIKKLLASVDWSNKLVIAHNISFDALIHAWRFGVRPAMWGCTASMARPKYAKTCGVSLAKLSTELGIGVKDSTALVNTKGKYLADFTPAEINAMREYNKEDTELCARLFKKLVKGFPRKEMWHVHATTQMLVNPQFELDVGMVDEALTEEKNAKLKALMDLADMIDPLHERVARKLEGGVDTEEFVRMQLASAAKFGEILVSRGVEVPMKPSPTNVGKMTPALAKTDEVFVAMQEHDDPVVAAAARARLAIKSTLLETRLQRFKDAAAECQGRLPIPTKYAGADTTGRRAGEIYNPLNLPRVPRDKAGNVVHKTSNALRRSMRAPKGYKVVVSDLSGIELRVNHYLWKVQSTMDMYERDPAADLYRESGAIVHGIAAMDITKEQRQVEKLKALGLGFGASHKTFQRICKTMGGLTVTLEESKLWVEQWRTQYSDIVDGWKKCAAALSNIEQGLQTTIDPWGMCVTGKDVVWLPSGRPICYPGMRKERDGEWDDGRAKTSWMYAYSRHKARITGPKADENLVQALARDVIADIMYDFWRTTKLEPVMECYDELVYIVPNSEADDTLVELNKHMRKAPAWWPEIILHSEGDIADTYGDAK